MAKQVVALGQLTPPIPFVVPDDCCAQPVPPLLVATTVPKSPAAKHVAAVGQLMANSAPVSPVLARPNVSAGAPGMSEAK
jgi:hypothetical protein